MELKDYVVPSGSKLELPEELTPSKNDVILLSSAYAGRGSETTAIMQYVYQSYVSGEFNKDISRIIEQIAMVEMKHQEFLGTAITRVGGDPIYMSNGKLWNAGFVYYGRNLRDMLQANILGEEEAIAEYKEIAANLENTALVPQINAIISDEETHIAAFKTILVYINFWN